MRKDLLHTSDLSPRDLALLLEVAEALKTAPYTHRSLLQGEAVVLYFTKPSTRTRISFEVAIARLGALPVMVGPNDLQLGRGETIEDTARIISRYARAFVIRTHKDEDARAFAGAATIPVINALTDGHHPCQSVADVMTIHEKLGALEGKTVAYLGAWNNVAHSLMEAAALTGVHFRAGSPAGYAPPDGILEGARRIATTKDWRAAWTEDPAEAASGADVIYTDVWLSMGDPEAERAARVAALRPYQVNAALMARAKERALFMHCLPAHRGEEVTADVLEGPQSVVLDQAENRLHTEVAILYALISGKLEGRSDAP